jgi:DNA modification methylase
MLRDIHPKTPVAGLNRFFSQSDLRQSFDIELVSALVGMSTPFISKVLGTRTSSITLTQLLTLLDQDAFGETFVPRSKIPMYLLGRREASVSQLEDTGQAHRLVAGNALEIVEQLPNCCVDCIVTSTPYWGTRLYDDAYQTAWADGELCPFGSEQTPEGFLRHSTETLYRLKRVLKPTASVWWNLMDSYNTRTQIRRNASETLRAMKGKDDRTWHDHECRRYSAGHSFLEDGEQCGIPGRLAERLSRIGYYVKSVIIWKKNGSMPETVKTRVTREIEVILHLSLCRSPYFDKRIFVKIPTALGGRNRQFESEKVTNVWHFATAAGKDGHGAQFPVALPGRCIALSTRPGALILDPFVGSGTTCLAAALLGRRSLGIDISERYLKIAAARLKEAEGIDFSADVPRPAEGIARQASLL